MRLHALLRKYRTEKEMTLQELSDLTDISTPLLSMMETGRVKEPAFRNMVKVALVLEIPFGVLVAAD